MQRGSDRILAISPLDKDATAAVYADGTWHALAEERLSRIKLHSGFPSRSVETLLRRAGLHATDLQQVVYPFMPWWTEGARIARGYVRDLPFTLTNGTPAGAKLRHVKEYSGWCIGSVREHRKYYSELRRELRALGLDPKLKLVEHHTAHAASAYLTSGYDEALALTLDWYGGGLSGSVNFCTTAGIRRLHDFQYPHSLGLFYAQVTSALGFKPSRHEGKIVGLAAFGDSSIVSPALLARLDSRSGDISYRSSMDPDFARDLAARYPREHVAAAYQHVLEVLACDIAAYWIQATGLRDVVLAGGVAANVKMNQRIAEVKDVRRVFIHPNMGDGGTGVGAILAVLLENGKANSIEWETCYLGPDYSEREMESAISDAGMPASRATNVARDVARALANGKVVARFNGALEYGPRALGNRSILYSAADARVNTWLNKRLGRTEFMPFAPVTLYEHRHARYHEIDKFGAAARFMTITCQCTELMKREAPAAVHVDGTARPQILRREDNPSFYSILEEYYKLTGVPTLINTSFNMHEEPIVCTPADALRAFAAADLDYLSMGPFLLASESSQHAHVNKAFAGNAQ